MSVGRLTSLRCVDLPVMPPVQPMLAKSVSGVPDPAKVDPQGLSFEPKWDGFRCILFRDGDEVELASRNTKPLTRYFPELVEAARAELPERCVLDGEIFVALDGEDGKGRLQFEVLQERIHPAASRITMLSETTPADFVAFDLLALGDESYVDRPFAERRAALEQALAHLGATGGRCHLTRTSTDPAVAEEWFHQFEGAGLDGVVAKPMSAPYAQNARTMLKIKHERTADVVLAGYREHKTSTPENPLIGSLLLGLYQDGELQHVGVSASFTAKRRAELWQELQPLVCPIEEHPWGRWQEFLVANPGRQPGTQSRWSQGKDLSFTPLRPERVIEVKYDAMEGPRFRHTAHFKRWRDDRDPESCGYEQLEQPVRYDLADVLGG
ncbi:ATP-dependent DNA ligase [Nocardioides sp. J9]|nr:ATP-dependent DNA ligase [Nocardioides sp. J9]